MTPACTVVTKQNFSLSSAPESQTRRPTQSTRFRSAVRNKDQRNVATNTEKKPDQAQRTTDRRPKQRKRKAEDAKANKNKLAKLL